MPRYKNEAGVVVDVPETVGAGLGADWHPVRDSGSPTAKPAARKKAARRPAKAGAAKAGK